MKNATTKQEVAGGSAGNAEASIANAVHLAERINGYHRAAQEHAQEELMNALAAGVLLLEAKEVCRHGEWLLWLELHFAGGHRTAQRYMRIASRWQKIVEAANASRVTHLSVNAALRLARSGRGRTGKKDSKGRA